MKQLKNFLFPVLFLCIGLSSLVSQAQTASPTVEAGAAKTRPKIALVLSGGGARGFAHIGVLRVLKEMRVPIDIVVGTSMGAAVGGAYAAGRPVEEIERIVRSTSWDDILADRPERDSLEFKRREEDLLLPSRLDFALTGDGVVAPPSTAGNSMLERTLVNFLPKQSINRKINQLSLPFATVASDLETGEMLELTDVSLFLSLRASLSIPGIFPPVHLDQRIVVDGGLVRNLPVDLARKMGADIVIAVNVGTSLSKEKELRSLIGVANQMFQILTEQNVQRSLKELTENDVLIAPNLKGIGILDFSRHHDAMVAGDIATRELKEKLGHLALTAEDYQQFEEARIQAKIDQDKPLRLANIEVQGSEHINPKILMKQSGLNVGEMTTLEKIANVKTVLYGRGDLEHVETKILDKDEQRFVTISTHEALSGRSRLRIGVDLNSNFADTNQFSIGAMHIASSINDNGAELRTIARIGSKRELSTQFFQPVSAGSAWYVTPAFQYKALSVDEFSDGRKNSRNAYKNSSLSAALGYSFSNWGDIQIGMRREFTRRQAELPEDSKNGSSNKGTSQFLNFRFDTLDSLAFPSRGALINATIERTSDSTDHSNDHTNFSLRAMKAWSVNDSASHIYGEWARSQGTTAPLLLGGFLRLSGLPANSISNKTVVFGRYVYTIGGSNTLFGGKLRMGFSMEFGAGFNPVEAITYKKLQQSNTAFLSFDTRFAPVYFGVGNVREKGTNYYLMMGSIW